MTIHNFVAKKFYYTFAVFEPAVQIHRGDTVIAETRDALGYDAELIRCRRR